MRLATCANNIDGVIYTAYSQLEKTEPNIVKRRFFASNVDRIRAQIDSLSSDIKPSWIKIWERPYSFIGFITTLLRSLIGEESLHSELNLSDMANDNINCFMLLINATNKNMKNIAHIAQDALPNWHIKVLNGDHTTNRDAEAETISEINRAKLLNKKGVVIIANQMGSRSYSIPEIQASVIAYDRGSSDATLQKISRCLTPTNKNHQLYRGGQKTHGVIVDLSFDPNRNENIERLLIDEAMLVHRSGDVEDFPSAIRYVLSGIDLFKYDYPCMKAVNENDLFKILCDRENLLRIADSNIDVYQVLSSDMFDILLKVIIGDGSTNARKAVLGRGAKNYIIEPVEKTGKLPKDHNTKNIQTTIFESKRKLNNSATDVYWLSDDGGNSYRECLKNISKDPDSNKEFCTHYGITVDEVFQLLDNNELQEHILDLVVNVCKPNPEHRLF